MFTVLFDRFQKIEIARRIPLNNTRFNSIIAMTLTSLSTYILVGGNTINSAA